MVEIPERPMLLNLLLAAQQQQPAPLLPPPPQAPRPAASPIARAGEGVQPNFSNVWGAIYRDGYIYVSDMNAGLWVVKVDAKSVLTP